jgi:DNA-binding LytR/AlgR family response regulator
MYIQREGKNAEIYDGNEIKKVRKSLQQVYDELDSEEFIFTDRGCIVNIIHVMQVKDGEAIMKNGEHLPISRSHLQDVKLKINSYWGAHI